MRLLTVEIRVAVVGNVDAGKSTLLGVLTHGELDNGRGTHGIFCVASLDLEKEKSENTITKKRKPTLLDRLGLSSDRHGSRRILRALVGSCSSPVIVLFVCLFFFCVQAWRARSCSVTSTRWKRAGRRRWATTSSASTAAATSSTNRNTARSVNLPV